MHIILTIRFDLFVLFLIVILLVHIVKIINDTEARPIAAAASKIRKTF